jgi:predicted nucleotidyltransferase
VQTREAALLLTPLLVELPSEVVAVYLYGSTARGSAGASSDLDLAFWRRTPSAATLGQQPYLMAASLEARSGREVDLIELNRAPADLVHHVLRDGIVLLDRDPAFRVRCEVAARAAYLDLLPVLHRYRAPRSVP